MKCKFCESKCVKNGRQQSGCQRWLCKTCNKGQQSNYIYESYKEGVVELVVNCLNEGCGLRSIQRITKVSVSTQLRLIRKLGKTLSNSSMTFYQGDTYEVDELKTFIGSKKNEIWVISALSRKTGKIVSVKVGRRNKSNLKDVIDSLLLMNPVKIFTDGLRMYKSIIPEKTHLVKRYGTNKLERFHLTLRTHLKRLTRRTICFSRNEDILNSVIKIYLWKMASINCSKITF